MPGRLIFTGRGHTVDFYLSARRDSKAAYRLLGKILNNVKNWQIPRFINRDKAPTYGRLNAKVDVLLTLNTDRLTIGITSLNAKRIIVATLGFNSMKTKGIEVMRGLRKG